MSVQVPDPALAFVADTGKDNNTNTDEDKLKQSTQRSRPRILPPDITTNNISNGQNPFPDNSPQLDRQNQNGWGDDLHSIPLPETSPPGPPPPPPKMARKEERFEGGGRPTTNWNKDALKFGAFSSPSITPISRFQRKPRHSFPIARHSDSSASTSRQSSPQQRPRIGWLHSSNSHKREQKDFLLTPPNTITSDADTSNLSLCSDDLNTSKNSSRKAPVIFMFDYAPITPFFTNAYCFSNHFPCENLLIDNVSYCCTEQYYMYYKARVFGDKEAMRQIMRTNDPKMMKRFGSRVVGFNQGKWYKAGIGIQVMVIASLKKYEQNPELRRQLFETSGSELVETNPGDDRWGIGLSIKDWQLRDRKEWRGLNILGRLLTKLRDRLLERPEFADERREMLKEIDESMDSAKSVGCFQEGRNEDEQNDNNASEG